MLRGAVCLWLLIWLLPACADVAPPQAWNTYDISAQELSGALEAFSRSSGMAVLVDRQLTRGRRSIGVQGRLTATQALNTLLVGTGLMARYARADAFTLQVAQVAPVPLPPGISAGGSQVGSSYALAIQSAIERRLCSSPLTRPGDYRALLQVWIGRDGAVQHSRLVTSSGDTQRDAALVDSVQHLRIERSPPSSLRQPVTLLLVPNLSGKRMECTQQQGAFGA
ncbi:secretin and TonB N-terminal domain-containing protein [Pseudomonas sp. dw_612]|uniref:secretin and TonB N-terminal domain-containing protein n=1 Tax=Pseudomonas sp. dw_612 TaxID=2720080 RepID=UPI00211724D3|nr:secretin and TonB N-terminal domain-containing protein [Pseudomonas sp. dw_612]